MALRELICLQSRGRTLRGFAAQNLTDLRDLPAYPTGMVCLLLKDSGSLANAATVEATAVLVQKGLCYLCAWGKNCEQVHDDVDRFVIDAGVENDGLFIMTTWHDEPLSEAFWFFWNCATPAGKYEKLCKDWVAVTITSAVGSHSLKHHLRKLVG